MGAPIVHYKGWFFTWSTISDAPSSKAMNKEDFEKWYKERHGTVGMQDLPGRLQRAIEYGSSYLDHQSAEDVVAGNRAGPRERELSFQEVLKLVGAAKKADLLSVEKRRRG